MNQEEQGWRFWGTLTRDLQRYTGAECRPWSGRFLRRLARETYVHPGLIAVIVYRYGQWVRRRCRIPILRQLCDLHYHLMFLWVRTQLSIEIPRSTEIGPGLRVDHFGYLLINSQVKAGRNLWVKPGVVIGQTETGYPTIGDDVEVGVGAKVLGKIKVGSNVIIGAQSVVTRDVPDNTVVAGVPARVLRSRCPGERECNEEG